LHAVVVGAVAALGAAVLGGRRPDVASADNLGVFDSSVAGTPAVSGRNTASGAGIGSYGASSGGFGVVGGSQTGVGVYGATDSLYVPTVSPNGVWGQANGTGAGVRGDNAGLGEGVTGTNTNNGVGVGGFSQTGVGVLGVTNGVSVLGGINENGVLGLASGQGAGVEGRNLDVGSAVRGNNTGFGIGVEGLSAGTSPGVSGTSKGGRGGVFGGALAAISLVPQGPPNGHPPLATAQIGDLALGNGGDLWFCTNKSGAKAWHQMTLGPAVA